MEFRIYPKQPLCNMIWNKKLLLLLLLLLSGIISCQQNTRQQQIQATLSQWHGKTLVVPRIISIQWNENDSCDLYSGNNYKIIYYIDGDCYACVKTLSKIDSVYQAIKTQHSSLLVYVHSLDYVLINSIKSLHIPLICDKSNSFYKQNSLLSDPLYHCFLLDKDNRVIIAGSFIANPKMTTLYSKILKSK